MGNLAGILRDLFWTHKIKAQTFRGKYRSVFREKFRSSKKNISCKLRSADVPPLKSRAIFSGSGKNCRRNCRESRDFGALR